MDKGLGEATTCVAAMQLAKVNEIKSLDSQCYAVVIDDAGSAAFTCILCKCSGQGPPALLGTWTEQKMFTPRALYSKELSLLAHVLTTACAGAPKSVCNAVEHFGEEVISICLLMGQSHYACLLNPTSYFFYMGVQNSASHRINSGNDLLKSVTCVTQATTR